MEIKKEHKIIAGLGAGAGILYGFEPEVVSQYLSAAMSNEVSKYILSFSLAAWIHSGRVKKEIASQLGSIVNAINKLSDTLEARIEKVEARVEALEKEKA